MTIQTRVDLDSHGPTMAAVRRLEQLADPMGRANHRATRAHVRTPVLGLVRVVVRPFYRGNAYFWKVVLHFIFFVFVDLHLAGAATAKVRRTSGVDVPLVLDQR
jgi:hypothetical protein